VRPRPVASKIMSLMTDHKTISILRGVALQYAVNTAVLETSPFKNSTHIIHNKLDLPGPCKCPVPSQYTLGAPNAWLCRIQREDFETVLGSSVATRRFRAGPPFQLPIHPQVLTIIPSTKYTPNSALPVLEDFWLPPLLQLRVPARLLFRLPYFRLYPLSRP